MHHKPIAAGKSSFDLIDKEVFFREIDLPEGTVILDGACGAGRYALALSPRLGSRGLIHAVDLWEEGIRSLEAAIRDEGITNIRPVAGDLARLSYKDSSLDAALLATVLHDLVQVGSADGSLTEIGRVLKPGGLMYVVEFKKIDGPPRGVRLSAQELRKITGPLGFVEERSLETGAYTYLSVFRLGSRDSP